MSAAVDNAVIYDRIRGALFCAFIGDALAMPVHWYYNPEDIARDFGRIDSYQAPKKKHPTSIMSLANTGGHGRGSNKGSIIGDVILHGKKKYWGPPGTHYHALLRAGENTLNAQCLRVVMRTITQDHGVYHKKNFLENYVNFMTTPDTHNDTYAESYHRGFFSRFAQGMSPEECAEPEGHDTASSGGLVTLSAVILSQFDNREQAIKLALEHLKCTHRSEKLNRYVKLYAGMLVDLVNGKDAKECASDISKQLNLNLDRLWSRDLDDSQVIGGVFTSACYIDGSFPSITYLLGKYHNSVEGALLANANVGGDNCHRGAALGSLIGAAASISSVPPKLLQGLVSQNEIKQEIEAYVEALKQARSSNTTITQDDSKQHDL